MIQTKDVEKRTWALFTKLFREKYLNEARLAAKVREFMDLKQGNMTVAEYAAKFKELARYAPKMIAFDDAMKMKFMHGLRLEVIKQVDSGEIGRRLYADAVQRVVLISGWDATGEKVTTTKTEGSRDRFGNPNQGYKPRIFPRTWKFQKNFGSRFQIRPQSGTNQGNHSNNNGRDGNKKRNMKRWLSSERTSS